MRLSNIPLATSWALQLIVAGILLQTLFFLVLHWLVVAANRQVPVQLSMAVWAVLGGYLVLVAAWLWFMWRRFRVPA